LGGVDRFQQVRHQLAASRARGEPWEAAWPAALAALDPRPYGESERDAAALRATAPSWRAAYLGLPAPSAEHAIEHLAEDEVEAWPIGVAGPPGMAR
jgi:hypothetical protein